MTITLARIQLLLVTVALATLCGCGTSGTQATATSPSSPTSPTQPTSPGSPSGAGDFPANFWDASNIPSAQNVMMFKFLNRTNGKYPDNQVFWSVNINGVSQSHSIADQATFDMPANSSGRIYFYLGSVGTTPTHPLIGIITGKAKTKTRALGTWSPGWRNYFRIADKTGVDLAQVVILLRRK